MHPRALLEEYHNVQVPVHAIFREQLEHRESLHQQQTIPQIVLKTSGQADHGGEQPREYTHDFSDFQPRRRGSHCCFDQEEEDSENGFDFNEVDSNEEYLDAEYDEDDLSYDDVGYDDGDLGYGYDGGMDINMYD